MEKRLIIFLFLVVSFGLLGRGADEKRVLVLNSYSRDLVWTEDQVKGIVDEITSDDDIKLYFEYMDMKNISSEEYRDTFTMYFFTKYSEKEFDLVYTTDDFALEFILDYKHKLRGNPYIIALGINNQSKREMDNLTILYERINFVENVELALEQFGETQNIYVVFDSSSAGVDVTEEVKAEATKFPELNFIWLDADYNKLKEQLKFLKEDSVILHLVYFRDKNGMTSKFSNIIDDIYTDTKVPIYVPFDFYFNKGNNIFGGYVLNGYLMGSEAGRIGRRYFANEDIPRIVENGDYSDYEFNYKMVEEFGIDKLPHKSTVLYEELTYLEENSLEIAIIIIIVTVSLTIILLLLENLKKKKKINTKNQEIMKLDKEVVETQKEIISRLGEVIENRSQETANHVERVAQISKYLGHVAGLSTKDCQILEVASPLHDVGKIAIPEEILNKPGKLNHDEFEIIKRHASIGYNILNGSKRAMMATAAIIAHEHHERWDGSGYPRGLKGEEINIFARITTVADVFDALLSKRVYKEAWSLEETLDFFEKERSRMFDPRLVKLLNENLDEVLEIREKLLD